MNTNKTGRKNKTKITPVYPVGLFTYEDFFKLNLDIREITLRSRLKKKTEAGEYTELGTIHRPKGRPALMFAQSPVSPEVLEEARKMEVSFHSTVDVSVLTIATPTVVETSPSTEPASVVTSSDSTVVTTEA